jgi:NAD(P)-dependent dehydrogenase (short-subunit alcohol dehydrogenase family)
MEGSRVAIVTGASSGIGRSTALHLVAAGYRVFGTAREPARLERIPEVDVLSLDVRQADSVRACVERVLAAAGHIDVLVNNAGYALLGGVEETSVEQARSLFETNFFGLMRMTSAVLPAMRSRRSGAIVNVSSVAGFLSPPFMGVYAASKHAVEAYSEALLHEAGPLGIRVLLVEPGFTRTHLDRNSQLADGPLADYDGPRRRAVSVINARLAAGAEPEAVGRAIAASLGARSPPLRIPVGREASRLRLLRWLAPARAFERGVRKQFAIDQPFPAVGPLAVDRGPR